MENSENKNAFVQIEVGMDLDMYDLSCAPCTWTTLMRPLHLALAISTAGHDSEYWWQWCICIHTHCPACGVGQQFIFVRLILFSLCIKKG